MGEERTGRELSDAAFAERARSLAWLLFDVDGVLTDGRLVYGPDGEELKTFHVQDGLGLKLAQRAGLEVGVLSGRGSPALDARLRDLDLDERLTRQRDKRKAFSAFLSRRETTPEKVGYVGDDLVDLPVLLACGLALAPADAVPEVRRSVHRVLDAPGGRGAARETVERVLRARDQWETTIRRYTRWL